MRRDSKTVLRVQLWLGFSRFQVPPELKVLLVGSDCSKHIALVFAVLYSIGSQFASRCMTEKEVIVKVTLNTLASRTGLSVDTVQRCLRELENRKLIKKWKKRTNTKTGRTLCNIYSLLHPQTGEPLRVIFTSERKKQGLCFSNGLDIYTAMPHYYFRLAGIFSRLSVAQQNSMLAALILGSEFKSMRFPMSKAEWRATANLSRKYFGPAVTHLIDQGLLAYDGRTLTLFDPETREESQRAAKSEDSKRLYVKGRKHWFDYDTVTAEQWRSIVKEVMPHRNFEETGTWSHRSMCPFQKHSRDCFAVNFQLGCWNCFGCGLGGKLSRLVKMVNKTDNRQTKEFIAAHCGVSLQERKEPEPLLESVPMALVMATENPYAEI
jgi:hypothetical protein